MEQNLSQSRDRGSWAPLVGAALAAVMVGSLVLFSVIAQRTTLDSLSEGEVAVEAPAERSTRAITVPPVPDTQTGDPASDSVASIAQSEATELILGDGAIGTAGSTTATEIATTGGVAPSPDDGTAAAGTAPSSDGDRLAALDTELTPFAFSASGGGSSTSDDDDKERPVAKSRQNGRADEAKAKGAKRPNKPAKARKAKGDDKRRNHGRRGRGKQHRGRAASGSANSPRHRPAAPARASRPKHAAKPARPAPRPASRPAPRSASASNHSNQKGKGHSKGRGRGHRH